MKTKLFLSEALVCFLLVFLPGLFEAAPCQATGVGNPLPRIAANTNQRAAGILSGGEITVELEIREGAFYPEDESGPSLQIFAFGERGKQLQIPGPMIRVPQDTRIHVTVHNLIARDVLIHGMHIRPGKNADTVKVAAGETRDLAFPAGAPGAYYYWATAGGDTLADRPYKEDSQLYGAFIVDPPGDVRPDRVFMIGTWRDRHLPQESFDVPVINGKSWPHTERLQYPVDSEVRWVWLNASGLVHPMHMHGSYFQVTSVGDAEHSDPVPPSRIRDVSTNFMAIGGTMTTLWKPEHTGRWLFHCHILTHMSPETSAFHHEDSQPGGQRTDPLKHMGGLVMGITVVPHNGIPVRHKPPKAERKLQLLIAKDPSTPKKYTYSILESRTPGAKERWPWADPGAGPQSTRGDSHNESTRRIHISALARNRTGKLLRWNSRMERRWSESLAHDHAREIIRRGVRTAARRYIHISHAHE